MCLIFLAWHSSACFAVIIMHGKRSPPGYRANHQYPRMDSGNGASMDTEEEAKGKRKSRPSRVRQLTAKKKKVWVIAREEKVLASYWEAN